MMTNVFIHSSLANYFHLCSDGALTPRFITSQEDFRTAFNLIGVCAANADVTVLAFSIEDTHLHSLLYGTKSECVKFKTNYEESWSHHIGRVRGSRRDAAIELELIPIDSIDYLMNVGTYAIFQPTKDGKQVMPYDYYWGTGSMYFRVSGHRSIWSLDEQGERIPPVKAGDLSRHELKRIICSHRPVPPEWLICNGILLPDNYVDTDHFEQIYRTANCFRVFLGNNRNKDQLIHERIAAFRGITIDDSEARQLTHNLAKKLFGFVDIRRLDAHQRIILAQELRKQFRLSARQIASLSLLPYPEVCKYI